MNAFNFYLSIVFSLGCFFTLKAQISPCLDGSQPSCKCSTATIICTPDELNDVMLPMSPFRHPQDAPTPLCSGDGAPDNPSWVGFTAWCESFSVKLILDNCSGMCVNRTPCRSGLFPCGLFGGACSFGVQVAVYESCDFSRAVACDVNECRESEIIFNLDNLVPGTTYYFMVDGCSGSACDVTFEVLEFCGKQELPSWESTIEGPMKICQQDPVKFTVGFYEFADNYHWFVNGNLENISATNDFLFKFDTLGEYEICVDISSGDCVFIEDDPRPICQKINVFQVEIDSLIVKNSGSCPEEPIFIQSFFPNLDTVTYSQILILDGDDNVLIQSSADTLTWFPAECGSFKIMATLSTQDRIWNLQDIFNFSDSRCDDFWQEIITVSDNESPTFLDTPDTLFLNCYLQLPDLDSLRVRDNCLGEFFVTGMEKKPNDLCAPNSWIRSWVATDNCGNSNTFEQVVSILDSFPLPQWLNPPKDTIIECNDIADFYESLSFNNFESDPVCQLSGSVLPQVTENIDNCKGLITIVWEYQDICGRTSVHTQNIKVEDLIPTEFYIPDIFNPQSTQGNSNFYISSNKSLNIDEFTIWDRWGNKVFEIQNVQTGSPFHGWNGTFNGRKVNSGVYLYSTTITLPDQNKKKLHGSVTVIF